jgi:hypothetical protein
MRDLVRAHQLRGASRRVVFRGLGLQTTDLSPGDLQREPRGGGQPPPRRLDHGVPILTFFGFETVSFGACTSSTPLANFAST